MDFAAYYDIVNNIMKRKFDLSLLFFILTTSKSLYNAVKKFYNKKKSKCCVNFGLYSTRPLKIKKPH